MSLFFMFLTSLLFADPSTCHSIQNSLEQNKKRLQSLEQDLQELTKKFDSAIHQDLDAQAGNIVTSVYRDTAKKALFAKTKLEKAIQKEKDLIGKTKEVFCKTCEPTEKSNEAEITYYCIRCKHPKFCKTFSPPDD